MARVPAEFSEEFEQKGDRFFAIAELLYSNPDRQYTQQELANRFNCSTTTISNHTRLMAEWLDRYEEQTTYAWDADAHNPASTETLTALRQFYTDLWDLVQKHSDTVPGAFTLWGFAMFLAGVVILAFYIGFSLSITADSAIPVTIYLVLSVGSFITGILVTLLAPFQAAVNGLIRPRLPERPFDTEE